MKICCSCTEHLDGNIASVNCFPVSLQNGKIGALDTGGSESRGRSNREGDEEGGDLLTDLLTSSFAS